MKKIKLTTLSLSLAIALAGANNAMASAFQLWEQDAGGIGDYHAGGAAEADSASTEWYNPAGMVRLKHKQVSAGSALINLDAPYKGTVKYDSAGIINPSPVEANGGTLNLIPNIHYVAPISDRWAFGIGLVVPFGLKTDYGNNTYLRYAGTETSLQSVDLTPALAFKINNKFSVGVGLDIVYSQGIFDQYVNEYGFGETKSENTGDDFAGGAHIGFLYQESSTTRFGFVYHSKIDNHMKGTSKFSGPLANNFAGGVQENHNLRTDFTLPAWTELSVFHQFNNKWSGMASATYTQWSSLKDLVLKNVVGVSSDHITIVIPENYSNTWNFAVGVHYRVDNKLTLKAGMGYDFTPSNDKYRNIQLPDQNRFAVSFGVRSKIKQNLWLDVGYTHLFVKQANINVTQETDQGVYVTTKGNVDGAADVFGAQLTWNI